MRKFTSTTFLIVLFALSSLCLGADPSQSKQLLLDSKDYRDISSISFVTVDLRYASTNNFIGKNMYGKFDRAFLHVIAWRKLKKAAALLQQHKPGWKIRVFDAARPRSVQRILWNKVKGTDQQPYVANPDKGSIHNFGFAIDLTLEDNKGQEVDMGTRYDDFSPLAQPAKEAYYLKQGKLSKKQLENRLLLRKVMTQAGFQQLPIEWWHYDALPSRIVRRKYRIIE